MVRPEVLLLSAILTAWNFPIFVKGEMQCKIPNVGGLVCESFTRRTDDRSAYELKYLTCAQGHKKEGTVKIPGKGFKQGRFLKMAKKQGPRALYLGGIFSRIKLLIARSCSLHPKDPVRNNQIITEAVKTGYIKIGSGNGKMYIKRFDAGKTWDEAKKICQAENGRLAKIDMKQKMIQIERKVSKPKDQFRMFYMWIGLRDFHRNNTFTWLDGTPLAFTNWHKTQPTHTDVLSDGTVVEEDCVALVSYVMSGLFWSDKNCGTKNGFICEKEI